MATREKGRRKKKKKKQVRFLFLLSRKGRKWEKKERRDSQREDPLAFFIFGLISAIDGGSEGREKKKGEMVRLELDRNVFLSGVEAGERGKKKRKGGGGLTLKQISIASSSHNDALRVLSGNRGMREGKRRKGKRKKGK